MHSLLTFIFQGKIDDMIRSMFGRREINALENVLKF
jgi:hypothetical protein